MADRHPDHAGVGRLRGRVLRHAGHPQGQAHLRGQLVLRRVHPDGGGAAPGQQRRDPGRPAEVVLGLRGRAGRDGPVVVRPQRGGLLPDRGLPGDDVLLRAQADRPPGLLVPAVDRALLGADLHLHVGGPAPPALHRAARLGAVAGHGVLADPAGAVLGRHDQRDHDAVGCLAQAARRPDPALPDRLAVVLRHVDLRGPDDVDQDGERAVALHRLDDRPRALRRARLGRHGVDGRAVLPDPAPVRPREDVQHPADRGALLGRDHRHRALRGVDVDLRRHAGPDVARRGTGRHADLLVRRVGEGELPVLLRAPARRPAVPGRHADHGLQRVQDRRGCPAGGRAGRWRRRRRTRKAQGERPWHFTTRSRPTPSC